MENIELVVSLNKHDSATLSAQLVAQLRTAIEQGALRPGDRLPATRDLAQRLTISRGTVVGAYEQLTAEGYLASGQGLGTQVNPALEHTHGIATSSPPRTPTSLTAHPANPQPAPIAHLSTRPAWRSAWRKAASSPSLGKQFPVEGDETLRAEVAEHLRTMRGTLRAPEEILITAGAREGLALLLTALGTTRGRELTIGVEDYAPSSLREVALRHGARVVSLPTDEHGLCTASLPTAVLDAVIVTPSFQYPSGQLLPLERRGELLAWGKAAGAVVIEDDFDSELRYLTAPLPTLAALDDPQSGVVATLGSYSATLSVTLAAGFLILPQRLKDTVLPVRRDLGNPVSPVLQLALTQLLASGELRKHVARLRRQRLKRETMVK